MSIDICQEQGHYVLYVDGEFFGSYDTVMEAARDVDEFVAVKEENSCSVPV